MRNSEVLIFPFGAERVRLAALLALAAAVYGLGLGNSKAQLVDRTLAPNWANEGIAKSFLDEVGSGRGDLLTLNSSAYVIGRDPFRAIRRGRQIFQRKFSIGQGVGPRVQDGTGDINRTLALGAGLADSCSTCHGRPRGSAGVGGDVATRPDSRDAPHLFGLGLKEMLADEITSDLREIRDVAIKSAREEKRSVRVRLRSKGISYGALTVSAQGVVETNEIRGVNADLRVRPFFAHGGKISIREFAIGALNDEMGLQAVDPELALAAAGARFITPAGMVLDGAKDQLEAPPAKSAADDPDKDGIRNEIPTSVVDYLEFYLLNYFKPGHYQETKETLRGRKLFREIGCAACHIPDLPLRRDRRVADVETVFDERKGVFNGLFATATVLYHSTDDLSGLPAIKHANCGSCVVKDIFTDLKRHDLGASFYEREYDGTVRKEFLTAPLWGAGSSSPYGHDGRSINLNEVILRHGGEALHAAQVYENLPEPQRSAILAFLNSLILFPPDDTASNLNPGNAKENLYPQWGHGSINLSVLYNDPADSE